MNKRNFMKVPVALCALLLVVLSGCRHKELCRQFKYADLIVKVDFKDVEKGIDYKQPGSMRLYVYKQTGEVVGNIPLDVYQYEGQKVTLPVGTFHMMVINEESNTLSDVDNLQAQNEYSIYNILKYKITTPLVPLLAKGMKAPKLKGHDDEVIISPATPTYVGLNKNVEVLNPVEGGDLQVIEFVPQDPLTRYTVIAKNVKNAQYYLSKRSDRKGVVSGALYSLSDGFFPYVWKSSDEFAIIPHEYILSEDKGTPSVSYRMDAFFRGFGSPANFPRKHMLHLFVIAGGEKRLLGPFDVTNQIKAAPDPRNVTIILDNIELPKPIDGFSVDVDEWKDGENVDVQL